MESNLSPTASCVHTPENHTRAQGTEQSTKMLPHALTHPYRAPPQLLHSSGVIGTVIQLHMPGSRNHSCFLHRLKAGRSWLAPVLMIHHYLSLSRKKCCLDSLDAVCRATSQLPGQVHGKDQDSGDTHSPPDRDNNHDYLLNTHWVP